MLWEVLLCEENCSEMGSQVILGMQMWTSCGRSVKLNFRRRPYLETMIAGGQVPGLQILNKWVLSNVLILGVSDPNFELM